MQHGGMRHPSLQPITIQPMHGQKNGYGILFELLYEKGRVNGIKIPDSLHANVRFVFYLKLGKAEKRKRLSRNSRLSPTTSRREKSGYQSLTVTIRWLGAWV